MNHYYTEDEYPNSSHSIHLQMRDLVIPRVEAYIERYVQRFTLRSLLKEGVIFRGFAYERRWGASVLTLNPPKGRKSDQVHGFFCRTSAIIIGQDDRWAESDVVPVWKVGSVVFVGGVPLMDAVYIRDYFFCDEPICRRLIDPRDPLWRRVIRDLPQRLQIAFAVFETNRNVISSRVSMVAAGVRLMDAPRSCMWWDSARAVYYVKEFLRMIGDYREENQIPNNSMEVEMNNTQLRSELLKSFKGLIDGTEPVRCARAKAQMAGKVLQSVSAQLKYHEQREECPRIEFFEG